MGLNKLQDVFRAVQVLTLAGGNVFDDAAKEWFNVFLFTVFAPNANDKDVFCQGYLLVGVSRKPTGPLNVQQQLSFAAVIIVHSFIKAVSPGCHQSVTS